MERGRRGGRGGGGKRKNEMKKDSQILNEAVARKKKVLSLEKTQNSMQ